jgi:putative methionine-R-sulfoxide reductase with GAF domain
MLPQSRLRKQIASILRRAKRQVVYRHLVDELSRIDKTSSNLEHLTQQIVNLIKEQLDVYYACLYLVDSTHQCAVYYAGTDAAGQVLRQRDHRIELASEQSPVALAIHHNEVHLLDYKSGQWLASSLPLSTHSEPIPSLRLIQDITWYSPLLPLTGSVLVLPLRGDNHIAGVLSVDSQYRDRSFCHHDIPLFLQVANQVARTYANFTSEKQIVA